MSKNRKGMRKEWHTKRIDYVHEVFIEFMLMLEGTFDLERVLCAEELELFRALLDALHAHRNGMKIETHCGCYLVEYGYDWVPKTDTSKQ